MQHKDICLDCGSYQCSKDHSQAIVRGRTFNHRDGMSELKKFEEDLAMPTPHSPTHTPRPQSLEFPLSLSNHPVSNEEVVLHDADGMRIAIFELESEAAYTLRAVNAYEGLKKTNDELLAAIKECLHQGSAYSQRLIEAIALSEKGE